MPRAPSGRALSGGQLLVAASFSSCVLHVIGLCECSHSGSPSFSGGFLDFYWVFRGKIVVSISLHFAAVFCCHDVLLFLSIWGCSFCVWQVMCTRNTLLNVVCLVSLVFLMTHFPTSPISSSVCCVSCRHRSGILPCSFCRSTSFFVAVTFVKVCY